MDNAQSRGNPRFSLCFHSPTVFGDEEYKEVQTLERVATTHSCDLASESHSECLSDEYCGEKVVGDESIVRWKER